MGKGDIEHRLKVYTNYLNHEIEVQGTLSQKYSDVIKSARAQGRLAALEEAVKILDNTFPEFKLGQLAQSEKSSIIANTVHEETPYRDEHGMGRP